MLAQGTDTSRLPAPRPGMFYNRAPSQGEQQPPMQQPRTTAGDGGFQAYRPQQQGGAPFSAYSPGQSQLMQSPFQGAQYGPQHPMGMQAYSQAYSSPPSFSPGAGAGNLAYAQPNQRPAPFSQVSYAPSGQAMDPAQLFAQRDAFIQNINDTRSQYAANPAAGRPQMDFGSMWGRAGDMVSQGWQNPFAPPQQSFGMDQMLGMLGQQSAAPMYQPTAFGGGIRAWDDPSNPVGPFAPPQPAGPWNDSPWQSPMGWPEPLPFAGQGPRTQPWQRQPAVSWAPPEPDYGGRIGVGPNAPRTLDWQDDDRNGIDDREEYWQSGPGQRPGFAQPIQPPSQGTPYQPGGPRTGQWIDNDNNGVDDRDQPWPPTRNAWDSGGPGQLPGPWQPSKRVTEAVIYEQPLTSPPAADNRTRLYHIQIGRRRADDAQAITNQFAYKTDGRPSTRMIVDQMNQAVAAYQQEPTSEREAMVNDIVRRAREAVQKDESRKSWDAKQPLLSARSNEDYWADMRLRTQYGIQRGQNTKQEIAAWRKAYDKMTAETAARREAYDKMNPAQQAIADRYGMGGPAHKSVAKQDGWGAGARSVAANFQEMLLLKNYTGDRNPDTSKIQGDTLSAIRDLATKKAASLSPKEVEAQRSLHRRLGSRNLETRATAEKELAKMLSGDSQKKRK